MSENSPDRALLAELESEDARLASAPPLAVLSWVFRRFGSGAVLACSFEDVALLHMARSIRPSLEVVFLDTGGHFPETLEFLARLERDWSLRVVRTTPSPEAEAWPCGTARCCELRKVEPLARALHGRSAWITALKRVDAPTRDGAPVVSWDRRFSLVKVNPLATWTDDDVAYYLSSHGLPEHPLWAKGYGSIGCAAMTLPPRPGESRRSGRWVGLAKDECGLHES
ncbi:MAG TPA: phosphoadenylyl-sulfate reductase [Acidimicrobiales bacterium]|nr:phosphoadenylyl-sulfate reductase [Acidimicrobiales bacterium]